MPVDLTDCLHADNISGLLDAPFHQHFKNSAAIDFRARIEIPSISQEVEQRFSHLPETAEIVTGMPFNHFGLVVDFENEAELNLYDASLHLHPHVKKIISEFGVCIFRNARMLNPLDTGLQKNIFPDLVFHVDRGHLFDNQYSLFYRDPADPAHRLPRKSTTLIMANAAAQLQAMEEGVWTSAASTNCKLFSGTSPEAAIGKYVMEQRWNAPAGTGEVCVFDNRTVLHASYHREPGGYHIAVQYLY